jgi:hypothetical protein
MHFAADPLELFRILSAVTNPDDDDSSDIRLTAKDCRFVADNGGPGGRYVSSLLARQSQIVNRKSHDPRHRH